MLLTNVVSLTPTSRQRTAHSTSTESQHREAPVAPAKGLEVLELLHDLLLRHWQIWVAIKQASRQQEA